MVVADEKNEEKSAEAAPEENPDAASEEAAEKEREQALQLKGEIEERSNTKKALRLSNQNASTKRPDEDFFRKLDSSLKKNTAFVKKLGKLTEQQRDSLSNEFLLLNLSKYVQEIVSALLDAKLKMTDVLCAVHLCTLIHQRYAEFSSCLYQGFKRIFQVRVEDKAFTNNINKVRTDFRFATEVTVAGIFSDKEGLTLIHNHLCAVVSADREQHDLMSVIISICKYCGEDLAGLVPRKHRLLADKFGIELPKSTVFSPEKQKIFNGVLNDYWESVKTHLLAMHKEIRAIDHRNRQILQNKGELHEEKSKEFSDKQTAYQKLIFSANTLADLLDVDAPDLPETEVNLFEEETSLSMYDPNAQNSEGFSDRSVWEDEDQRSFYTDLLDLKVIIPAILFKTPGGKKSKKSSGDQVPKRSNSTSESKSQSVKPSSKAELAAEELENDIADLEIGEVDETDKLAIQEAALARAATTTNSNEQDDVAADSQDTMTAEEDDDDINISASIKCILDNFINSLKDCVNRDLVDKAAQDFCMNMNTRANRKKLARAMFNVHRSRLDLLPFYSRLAATLFPCVPDVSEHLVMMLFRDFRFHVRKKDQIHVESKVKTVKFIGEMTKFGLIPPADTLNCLKILVLEFSPHTIEMACALLETCGRFLLRSAASHLRAKVLIEQLVRKRTAKALDQRYNTLIDNAWYSCDPPQVEATVFKPRPPLHEYIRKLIFRDLSKSTVEKVLRQMRKLPWNEPDINAYIVKCLSQSWNLKFNNIHCLASLIAGLVGYRDDVGHCVVDDVLEETRVGMEINHPRYNQRRFSNVKFLGELYNYRMLESTVIFNVLYSFVTFGVAYDVNMPSPLDPPENLFRIRLICLLLETCGQYFDRGSSKKKLDYFLCYFQRYIWLKKSHPYWRDPSKDTSSADANDEYSVKLRFPVEVDYLVQDTIEPLRPKLQLATSLEMACDYVAEVEKEVFTKLSKVVSEEQMHGLGDIPKHVDQQAVLADIVEIPEDDPDQVELYEPDDGENEDESTVDVVSNVEDENQDAASGEPTASEQSTSKVLHVKCPADDEFKSAFDDMVNDNMHSRKVPSTVQELTVPLNLQKTLQQSKAGESEVKFALLTKKGNKPTLKALSVSATESLAVDFRDRLEAEERRKQEMKQITLSINERQVEEEQHQIDNMFSRTPPANLNRERRLKYQPPKGAPNADLIFNTGGRRR